MRMGVDTGTPDSPAEVDFVLESGHWLSGIVIDETSDPVQGASVQAMPTKRLLGQGYAYPGLQRDDTTDDEGRFRLESLPGPMVSLRVTKGDYRHGGKWSPTYKEKVKVNTEIELMLKRFGVIRGRVVDKAGGMADVVRGPAHHPQFGDPVVVSPVHAAVARRLTPGAGSPRRKPLSR